MSATVYFTTNYENQPPGGVNPIKLVLSSVEWTQFQGSAKTQKPSRITYNSVGAPKSDTFLLIVIDLPRLCWYSIAAKLRKLNRGTIVAN